MNTRKRTDAKVFKAKITNSVTMCYVTTKVKPCFGLPPGHFNLILLYMDTD